MTTHELTFPLNRQTAQDISNLRFLHRRVMSLFPQTDGHTDTPRRDLGVLFRVCFPGEPLSAANAVKIIARDTHLTFEEGQHARLLVRLAAERRSDNGTRPVRDDEVDDWAASKLTAAGFTVHRLAVGEERVFGGRGIRFTTRDIQAEVTVADSNLANNAASCGLGRGKNYGLGMLLAV